ncbi:hypothetical protein AAY78_04000 [Microbacterium sp. Ag1]|nr:hypothetical protein AAY78_04000 [Microbacterium sp. Ag1]
MPTGRQVSGVPEYPVRTPGDEMSCPGDDATATAGAHVLLLRLRGRHRLNGPLAATSSLGALPAGEETIE